MSWTKGYGSTITACTVTNIALIALDELLKCFLLTGNCYSINKTAAFALNTTLALAAVGSRCGVPYVHLNVPGERRRTFRLCDSVCHWAVPGQVGGRSNDPFSSCFKHEQEMEQRNVFIFGNREFQNRKTPGETFA